VDVEHFTPEITRRAFLRSLPPALATVIAGQERATGATDANGGSFSFFQINDLHFHSDECAPWFRAVVEQMKASAPEAELCLLCGDVADQGAESTLAAVREIFSTLKVPLYPVPGNHDFTEEQSRAGYDAIFPGKLNYHFQHRGWQFLGLDSTMGTAYEKTRIAETTLAWLEQQLPSLSATTPTVAFTHFPLGEGVTYRPTNAEELLARLLKLNVAAAFSGHWHGASERRAQSAVLTTSRCCARVRKNADGSPRKGWFVCEARPDGSIARRFVEFQPPAGISTPDNAAPQSGLK
jgi:hypothetical protein